ncbi:MAG: hypothetical protein QM538_03785 [Methylacidiphilales bacterium]|nr:hypothetical protein [Candidatus Methylacidiphilales bacterium]
MNYPQLPDDDPLLLEIINHATKQWVELRPTITRLALYGSYIEIFAQEIQKNLPTCAVSLYPEIPIQTLLDEIPNLTDIDTMEGVCFFLPFRGEGVDRGEEADANLLSVITSKLPADALVQVVALGNRSFQVGDIEFISSTTIDSGTLVQRMYKANCAEPVVSSITQPVVYRTPLALMKDINSLGISIPRWRDLSEVLYDASAFSQKHQNEITTAVEILFATAWKTVATNTSYSTISWK